MELGLRGTVALALAGAVLLSVGCASPGPPRAPSLQLPAVVTDLKATRQDNSVELRFAVPAGTTDGQAYRGAEVRATVCRAVDAGSCLPVPSLTGMALAAPGPQTAAISQPGTGAPRSNSGTHAGRTQGRNAAAAETTLRDTLPAALRTGPARLLTYRLELSNTKGRSAGFGDAAYSAAGASPPGVAGLRAEGSRDGVVVRWQPDAADATPGSEVVLRRELVSGSGAIPAEPPTRPDMEPLTRPETGPSVQRTRKLGLPAAGRAAKRQGAEPGLVWLSTTPAVDPLRRDAPALQPSAGAHGVLDDGAGMNSTYRYAAERQQTVQLGGHTVMLRSGLSAPVEVTLRAVYPPPAPTDLVGTLFPAAAGDASGGSGGLAVDLIWTPADDKQVVGYNVIREALRGEGSAVGSRVRLTAVPVRVSAFHEVLPAEIAAAGRVRLRYSVTAVDESGLESSAAVTVVETIVR